MFPAVFKNNFRNARLKDIKSFSQFSLTDIAMRINFPDFKNIFFGQFRHTMNWPSCWLMDSNSERMFLVLRRSDIFKIGKPVVGLNSVLVVNLRSFWTWPYKSISNQVGNLMFFLRFVYVKINHQVSILHDFLFQNNPRLPSIASTNINSHLAKITNRINSLISNSGPPSFFHLFFSEKKSPFSGVSRTVSFLHLLGDLILGIENPILIRTKIIS